MSDSLGGSTHTYAATGLPTGLKINSRIGASTGNVGLYAAAPNGSYTVIQVAVDGIYSNSTTFPWNVVSPVTSVAIADPTKSEGDCPTRSVSAVDSTSGTLVCTAMGLKISTSTGAIPGTVASGTVADGPYSVSAVAHDGTDSASPSFTGTITSPVSLMALAAPTTNESGSVSLALTAAEGSGSTLVFDATGLPAGLRLNSSIQ